MDSRIKEKIDNIKLQEENKKTKERIEAAAYEERRKKEIIERLPEARDYVVKYLFDKIAIATTQNAKELRLEWHRGDLAYIPVESIAQAVSEIDGLYVRKEWNPEWTGHCNSDEVMETIPEHYEYYVRWSK
jgi:hypothetical protein